MNSQHYNNFLDTRLESTGGLKKLKNSDKKRLQISIFFLRSLILENKIQVALNRILPTGAHFQHKKFIQLEIFPEKQ